MKINNQEIVISGTKSLKGFQYVTEIIKIL
jgi:hypothetical protein